MQWSAKSDVSKTSDLCLLISAEEKNITYMCAGMADVVALVCFTVIIISINAFSNLNQEYMQL